MKTLLPILLIVSIEGCSEQPKDSIVVGMTYDIVEKHMGRPVEIVRGFTDVKFERGLPGTEASLLSIHYKEAVLYPSEIETKGQLVYVAWRYNDFAIDSSTRLTFPVYTTKSVGSRLAYFFGFSKYGKEEVFEEDYYKFKVGEAVETDFNSANRVQCRKPPKDLDPRFIYEILKKYSEHVTIPAVVRTEQKITYHVAKQYTVLFDASSGRVTDKGYYPVAISKK